MSFGSCRGWNIIYSFFLKKCHLVELMMTIYGYVPCALYLFNYVVLNNKACKTWSRSDGGRGPWHSPNADQTVVAAHSCQTMVDFMSYFFFGIIRFSEVSILKCLSLKINFLAVGMPSLKSVFMY